MRSVSALVALLAALAACSTVPHFTSGSGASGGNATTSTTSGHEGGAQPCQTAGDCTLVDQPCAHPTCTGGVCAMAPVPAGQPTTAQIAGDCKKVVCDGAGFTTAAADPQDLGDDGNDCTTDACNGSTPAHTPLPKGTKCGATTNLSCDGKGSCLGCTTATDCGAHGACFTWTCTSGACQQHFVASGGGSPPGNVGGDCHRLVCDGSGGVVSIVDDGDTPPDPGACVYGACSGGNPTSAYVGAGTGCGGGLCDGSGSCVGCLGDADCGSPSPCKTPRCSGGSCGNVYAASGTPVGGSPPGDCHTNVCDGGGGVVAAVDDGDVPGPPDACHTAACSGGSLSYPAIAIPPTGNPCTQNVCDPASGVHAVNVTDGTICGGCSICSSGTCAYLCGPCDTCYGDTCYDTCGGGG
jgi:hypothetical protein